MPENAAVLPPVDYSTAFGLPTVQSNPSPMPSVEKPAESSMVYDLLNFAKGVFLIGPATTTQAVATTTAAGTQKLTYWAQRIVDYGLTIFSLASVVGLALLCFVVYLAYRWTRTNAEVLAPLARKAAGGIL